MQGHLVGFEPESLSVDVMDCFLKGFVLERFDLAAVIADDVVVMMAGGFDLLVAMGRGTEIDFPDQSQVF